jgi:hypothetical protein
VLNLVFWSFVVALTPAALGSAWKLVSGILHWIALKVSRAFEEAEHRGWLRPVSFNQPSGCISVADGTSWLGAARSWAPDRRVPSLVRRSSPTGPRNDA